MAVRWRRDTGKWLADVRDAFGRRRQVTFDTKESAKDFAAEQRRARKMRRFTSFDPETTLEAYAESWLATRSVKAATRDLYGAALHLHILPALGGLRVAEVTRERARRYLAEKLGSPAGSLQGRRPKREKRRRARPLHRNTVRNQLKVLSGILNAAAADQLIPANPLQGLGRELFGRTRRGLTRKVKALDEEQLAMFLEAARRRPDTYPAFAVMALTGLRLGEAIALRWEDVDWRTAGLNITRQLTGSLKTPESERRVDIPHGLLELLRQFQAEKREAAFREGRGEPAPWLLFPELPALPTSTDETRIGHRLRRDMERALKAAGVATAFTPHALRHSYASRLISDGVSPEYVRRQLGHANIGITLDLYGRWLPMAPPEGALERLAAPLAGPGCNESATNGGGTELLATGTDGPSVVSSRCPETYPRSPCVS